MRTPHTPGPWRPHVDLDHYDSRMHNIRVRAVELEEHPQGPLTVAILNQNLDDQAIANARLIAAAPELLRSLHYIAERLQHGGQAAKSDCLTQCQWAITKATTGDLDQ